MTGVKDGENLLKPHRRHFYHLLANEKGIDHWKISVGYGVLLLIVGLSVLPAKPLGIWAVLFLLGAYSCGFWLVSYFVRLKVPRG